MGILDVIRDTAARLLDDKSNENTLYLRRRTPDELLRQRFRLPEPEGIVVKLNAAVCLVPLGVHALAGSAKLEEFVEGRVVLTESFIIFESSINPRDLTFVLPLSTIRRVERLPSVSTIQTLKIALIQDLLLVLDIDELFTQCERFCSYLSAHLRTQVPLAKSLRKISRSFYSEYLVESAARRRKGESRASVRAALNVPAGGLGRSFGYPGDAKLSHERAKMRLWLEYLVSHGRNLGMVRTQEFFKLVRVGLPNALRGELWELCCGAAFLRMKSSQLYSALLEENKDKESQATEEIAKDLHRSLPEYAAYQTSEGLEKLRRVLVAYSWMCPDVGYCQAMNIVVATLLIYQTEDQAFWTLHELVTRILPGYYSRTMYGMLLDQKVLEKLVEKTMPVLWQHLQAVDVPLSVISLPWFLSLYANSMPLPFALRVIDILMLEGSKVLFQVALAVLKVNAEALMQASDNTAVVAVLKHYFTTLGEHTTSSPHANGSTKQITRFQELLVTAFLEFGVVNDEYIHELRGRYEAPVLEDIELYAKKTAVRRLQKPHNLTLNQEYAIYDSFHTALQTSRPGLGGETGELEFYQFVSFLGTAVTWASPQVVPKEQAEHQPFTKRLFKGWGKGKPLSLAQCVKGLDQLACTDLMEAINQFYELYAPTKPQQVVLDETEKTNEKQNDTSDTQDTQDTQDEGLNGQTILEIADALLFLTKSFTEKHNRTISLDSVSKKQLHRFSNQPEEIVQQAVEKVYQQQSARYLASVSSFIQRAFEVAGLRSVEPKVGSAEITEVRSLIDDIGTNDTNIIDEKKTLSLPHFRMVVLADETLELFFSQTLPASVQVKARGESVNDIPTLRSVMDAVVREGMQFADGLRGRVTQLPVSEAQDEITDDLDARDTDRALLDL